MATGAGHQIITVTIHAEQPLEDAALGALAQRIGTILPVGAVVADLQGEPEE